MVKRLLEFLLLAIVVASFAALLLAGRDPETARVLRAGFEGASHDLDPDYGKAAPRHARKATTDAPEPAAEVVAIFMSAVVPPLAATPWQALPTPEALALSEWPTISAPPADKFTDRDIAWLMAGVGAITIAAMWRGGSAPRAQQI